MFGKKKKDESPSPVETPSVEDKTKGNTKGGKKRGDSKEAVGVADNLPQTTEKKKRKLFSKKIFFIMLVFISVGIASFVVYKIYFTKKVTQVVKREYIKKELPNIILAEEVIRFSFDLLPEFYDSTIIFNDSVIALENEVKRLNELGKQFPDQIKIAEKEIKVIEKENTKLKQTYEKLEKKVEALYVSYKVNQESGIKQIEEQKNEIFTSSKDALAPVLELTKRIYAMGAAESKEPEGFVKKAIYKIRQKIGK
ncbi:MAG: hypothetical protein HQK72_16960 [Desulfamplus sp.]|nr:hypothetical protein [Desulfamplus sp.]